jgi:WD40-like Beta Propeller Repeat
VRFVAAALALCVLVAAGAAPSATAGETSPKACPGDPSLGVVRFPRGDKEHVVSLATCTDKVAGKAAAWRPPASFRSRSGLVAAVSTVNLRAKRGTAAITVDGRVVYRVAEHYGAPGPILLAGWSPDSRWLLFTIDPMSSASIMADGLQLRALQVSTGKVSTGKVATGRVVTGRVVTGRVVTGRVVTGRVVPVADMLFYPDYLSWCGSTLVLTAGGDRTATTNKRLVAASAPTWKPRTLWTDPKRAFGSVACAPDGKSVVVLSQPASDDANFFHTRWQLWRISLAVVPSTASRTLLDTPPAGFADESPRWSHDGRALLFVRERKGYGQLMLFRNGRATGPFADLGYSLGYYGHHDWWLGATWSVGA